MLIGKYNQYNTTYKIILLMINKIFKKIEFTIHKNSIHSFEEFIEEKFNNYSKINLQENKIKLESYYNEYINNVSSPDMAISLELATFLYTYCKINKCKKIVDLGSGFSSFVLRLYASDSEKVEVYSVDDDEQWLKKTETFLNAHKLNTDKIFTLNQFKSLNESNFDLILLDLNFTNIRIQYIEYVLSLIGENGILILDDVHKKDYLSEVLSKLKNTNLKLYDLKPITLDIYGRFSLVVTNK
jgi:predicted O-methyltransferase YrrM